MKPEAQRIAIAEACGIKWRIEEIYAEDIGNADAPKWVRFEYPNGTGKCDYSIESGIPDYLNDLNAMHEAEKVLTGTLFREYGQQLHAILTKTKSPFGLQPLYMKQPWSGEDIGHIAHATAAQRAEAFLRTIGKWTDDN